MRPHLSSFEIAWTDAAAAAIFPEPESPSDTGAVRGSHLPEGILRMHPARFLDEVLMAAPLEQFFGLRLTLWMVALAPLFTIRRFGTIASISEADRTRVLERLVTSPLYAVRQLAMSFKAVVTLLYVQSAAVRRAMSEPLASAPAEPARQGEGNDLVSATRLTARGRAAAAAAAGEGDGSTAEGSDHAAA